LLINGVSNDYITPTCEIQQGGSLLPYLFILGAKGLSVLFTKTIDQGVIKGLQINPHAPKVHHLFFADDNFLFGEDSTMEFQIFKAILNIYEQVFGQRINL
jgi:hypothetical protein